MLRITGNKRGNETTAVVDRNAQRFEAFKVQGRSIHIRSYDKQYNHM